MNREKNDSPLYRQIMRCKADTRREVIIYLSVVLLLTALGLLCCFGVYHSEGLLSAAGLTLVLVACIGTYSFFSLRKMKKMIAVNRKKAERVSSLSDAELLSLEAQIERAEFLYKTYYILDDFLYVPKIKLLIPHSEVRGIRNILHKTDGVNDGMQIEITDTDGLVYEAWVKKWRDYYKDHQINNGGLPTPWVRNDKIF